MRSNVVLKLKSTLKTIMILVNSCFLKTVENRRLAPIMQAKFIDHFLAIMTKQSPPSSSIDF
ncbi:MAG TPA: hypothetical protein PKA52_13090, partial [bacterium]|nr:hypothetical protein [bacterium]